MRTVSNTNAVSERNFAQLDRMMCQKPNADTVALEGMILYANNRVTGAWLAGKTAAEHALILSLARWSSGDLCCLNKPCYTGTQEYWAAELARKAADIQKRREKGLIRKESTANIKKYCLWCIGVAVGLD